MRTGLVIVVAVLALGVAAFLLLRKEGDGFLGLGGASERNALTEEERELLEASPTLQGNPTSPRPRTPTPTDVAPDPGSGGDAVLLRVRVVDDATGAPVAGARLSLEIAGDPCPRLRSILHERLENSAGAVQMGPPLSPPPPLTTNAEGVQSLTESSATRLQSGDHVDVFARAPGYVVGVACRVTLPGEAVIRLIKGLALRGRVVDRQGKRIPMPGVDAEPGPGTPAAPGHGGWDDGDEQGAFVIDGLLPGALTVTVFHGGFWPLTVENEDPADPRERTYVLQPAFVLKFRLRTNDGRDIVSPTLQVTGTSVRPAFSLVQILKLTEDKTNDGVLTVGVPVPASLGTMALEVKAEGYAAWRAPEVVVPPEGGEQTFPITLGRDTGQGGVRLKFEDERGQPVKYGALNALPPTIQPLERQDLAGGIVYEVQDDLRFPSLPTGRYRFGMAAFAYAPVSVEAVVFGGSEAEVRVPLRAAARLRVRFTAPTARTVRFRLMQGGRQVPALPEKAAPRDPAKPEEDAVLASGEEGVVLGGLGSGSYVVEVVSEDLQPSRTSVSVREGETEEIEIRVQPR